MKAVALGVAAMFVVACGSVGASPGATIKSIGDVDGNPCAAQKTVTGVFVEDPEIGLAVRDDEGVVTQIVWPGVGHSSFRRTAEGEVEALENGDVVAVTGLRYQFAGTDFPGGGFWACAGPPIPA